MTKKLLATLALALMIAPIGASAAVDRVVIQGFGNAGSPSSGDLSVIGNFFDGNTYVNATAGVFSIFGLNTPQQWETAVINAVNADALANGYANPSTYIMPYLTPSFVQSQIDAKVSAMSFATSTRSLNSAFQVSASKAAFVSYTVDIATALSLTTGQTGTATLQYADDSGFTTNVVTVQSAVNGNAGTLTIGLNTVQTGTASLTGIIPAGKYVKIVTANTVGTPTFTYRAGQEVLMPSN